jgi:hypothetical protein
MTDRELMQQALEALENSYPMQTTTPREHFEAITALREALAEQPAQPQFVLNGIDCSCGRKWRVTNNTLTASPPAQRTWVGLTNDEVNNLAAGCHLGNSVQDAIYKAAAKLKEKNT